MKGGHILQNAEKYKKYVDKVTPGSRKLQGFIRAFWVGGVISAIGQGIGLIGQCLNLSFEQIPMFTSSVLVFAGAFLTGIGVYDKIGRYAGAGSIVPITGFANSVCAPAMEFRREGIITGIGTKLFAIAGPVLTFGISASVIYGILYAIFGGLGL